MDAGIHRRDEFVLPGPPLELPDAEPRQHRRTEERRQRDAPPCAGPAGIGHGSWLGSCSGIMLALRWYITQSEPDSMITTTMMVKSSAVIVQPPSAFGEMEEIDHVDDDLDHGKCHDRGSGDAVGERALHHQVERDRGEDHREHEADDIVTHRTVRDLDPVPVIAMPVIAMRMCVLRVRIMAHRSIPIR